MHIKKASKCQEIYQYKILYETDSNIDKARRSCHIMKDVSWKNWDCLATIVR